MSTNNSSSTNRTRRNSRLLRRDESIEEQIEDLLPEEDGKLGKAYDGRLVRRLSFYLRPYTGRLILAIVLMVISSLLAVSQPLIIGLAIDEYPAIAEGFDEPLSDGMVIALEPKIGMEGVGIVGTENTFEVSPEGGRCLTGKRFDMIPVLPEPREDFS